MKQVIKIYNDIFTALNSLKYRIVYRNGTLDIIKDELSETVEGAIYRYTDYEEDDIIFGSYNRYSEAVKSVQALKSVPKAIRDYVDKENRKNNIYKVRERIDSIDCCKGRNMFCKLKDGSILPYVIIKEDENIYILKPNNIDILSEFKSRKEAKSWV